MAYTEVKRTSYGSRVSSSFKGIGTGLILFVGATVLLWWNEGRAVTTHKNIQETGKNATHIESLTQLDSSLEGTLIHANGNASTQSVLTDGLFGVSANAMMIEREVEYYQWQESSHTETKENLGGSKEEITTYTYERGWSSSPVNSNNFKDPEYKGVNTVATTIDDKRTYADRIDIGAYTFAENQISQVASCAAKSNLDANLSAETIAELSRQVASYFGGSMAGELTATYVHSQGNVIYIGRNPQMPAVGDVRITLTQRAPSCDLSLIAVVKGNSFTEYITSRGDKMLYITGGTKTLEQMIQDAEDANTMLTWVLRILGLILVCAGLKGIFGFLVTILKVVPFLANILNWGVGLVCNVVGFVWTLIIVAIAWIFYRPLLGIGLLVVAGGLVYFFAFRGKDKKQEVPEVATPQA